MHSMSPKMEENAFLGATATNIPSKYKKNDWICNVDYIMIVPRTFEEIKKILSEHMLC